MARTYDGDVRVSFAFDDAPAETQVYLRSIIATGKLLNCYN